MSLNALLIKKNLINSWLEHFKKIENEEINISKNGFNAFSVFFNYWMLFNASCYLEFGENANKDRINGSVEKIKKLFNEGTKDKNGNIEINKKLIFNDNYKKIKINEIVTNINEEEEEKYELSISNSYSENEIYKNYDKNYLKNEVINKYILEIFTEKIFDQFKNSLKKDAYNKFFIIDLKHIKKYNEKLIDLNDSNKIETYNWLKDKGVIIELKTNNINLSNIRKIIYQIRCNLFHGGKNPHNENDINIVTGAIPILKIFLKVHLDELYKKLN